MRKRILDLTDEKPLLDIAAIARKGRLPTPAERLHISLTVHRAPEVMVKVSGGARTLSGVERHMAYIGRDGTLGLDVDTAGHVGGKGFERDLVREWDLDVDALQNHTGNSGSSRKPLKLVHNIIFSMPPGTSPRAVLTAVQRLALNEWALEHRYAMALHTDNDHPHVHVVLKAVSEQGARLNIRKATLRSWRAQFAMYLRELGVDANATERAVRGRIRTRLSDGAYRSNRRKQSTLPISELTGVRRHRTEAEFDSGNGKGSKSRLTQGAVRAGWAALTRTLAAGGDLGFADDVGRFAARLAVPEKSDRLAPDQKSSVRKGETGPDVPRLE